MKGLIHIGLGHGYIILEPARNRYIRLMNHAQSRIALSYGINNYPYGKEIVDLIQSLVLIYHLPVNGEEMLCSAVNSCLDSVFPDML